MSDVQAGLPEGVTLRRWRVDVYADEPYCDNFRGERGIAASASSGRRRKLLENACLCAAGVCQKPGTTLLPARYGEFKHTEDPVHESPVLPTEFKRRRGSRLLPLDPPATLPPPPSGLAIGDLPDVGDFAAAIAETAAVRRESPTSQLLVGTDAARVLQCYCASAWPCVKTQSDATRRRRAARQELTGCHDFAALPAK